MIAEKYWRVFRTSPTSLFLMRHIHLMAMTKFQIHCNATTFFSPSVTRHLSLQSKKMVAARRDNFHSFNFTVEAIHEIFSQKLISEGDNNRLLISLNLSPMNFPLWGYLKYKVYTSKSESIG